ncbi:MAG: argininosuccinate synthase [Bacillota bacterium]|nr:argininosuccinate synthase [Bacillota bacterium]MDI7249034.1 argininosuccinate synthase [Bacillota bacterium]
MDKVVLAYSGGLDTSVAIHWLKEKYGMEVVALIADLGEGRDLDALVSKAVQVGAVSCRVVDARERFAREFVFPALRAHAVYEGVYPLSAGLSRPLIARLLVDAAHAEGAKAVAHGCTGKGNDQVRFDVSVAALDPSLKVIAPVREWSWSREEEIDYAREHGIPVPVGKRNPFSIDQNLWGRSVECGVLEDPWVEPPAEAFAWTRDVADTPSRPCYLQIEFAEGIPVAVDGEPLGPVDLLVRLNQVAGEHGVGRIDHVENRLVGIKSREVYEAPAATVLLAAHRALETLCLPRETAHFKTLVEQKYAELVYFGLWYSPLREALDAFVASTQRYVTGTVRVKLHHGTCQVVGRRSPYSLYDYGLATYDPADTFRHDSAVGFIDIWGLPTRVAARVQGTARAAHGAAPEPGPGGSAEAGSTATATAAGAVEESVAAGVAAAGGGCRA